jgi:hypothetical protein
LLIHNILTNERVRYLRYVIIACLLLTISCFSAYKKEVTLKNILHTTISEKEIELNGYEADKKQLDMYVSFNSGKEAEIKDYIEKNLYFSNIYNTFGRFYNYLVMNLELLGFPFKVSYPDNIKDSVKDQRNLFLDYTVNSRYKTGYKVINILVNTQILTTLTSDDNLANRKSINKELTESIKRLNSTVFLSQISTLLNLFVVDLKSIKYNTDQNMYTLNFTILGS